MIKAVNQIVINKFIKDDDFNLLKNIFFKNSETYTDALN